MVDDGSTEDLFGLFQEYTDWERLYYWHPHGDPLLGVRARNQGMRLVPSKTSQIWITDGDIVFNPNAVLSAYGHLSERPRIILAGRYDWMPRMQVTVDDLTHHWGDFVKCALPRLPMESSPGGRLGAQGSRNLDPRHHWGDCYREFTAGGAFLGSNVIIPVQAFRDTDGYDENMPPASNSGDCEIGFHLGHLGYKLSMCQCIRGYHLYHYRDELALTLGVRKGIVYIHDKYPWLPRVDLKKDLPKLPPGVRDEWSQEDD